MRLFLLISLTMVAFAANSVLNRLAVDQGGISAELFSAVRVLSGALVLLILAKAQGASLLFRGWKRVFGALALAVYMVGFSLAYGTLDAGAGALILFGATQITMFGVVALSPIPPTLRQMAGAGIALAGLGWVLWPGAGAAVPLGGAFLMVCAGIGWGGYSLIGRAEHDALGATAANFALALPLVCVPLLLPSASFEIAPKGVLLAVISGAVTSGLGYALWYRLLPALSGVTAASVMLSVPIIALVAGAALLGEQVGLQLAFGALVVLGGIAFAVRAR